MKLFKNPEEKPDIRIIAFELIYEVDHLDFNFPGQRAIVQEHIRALKGRVSNSLMQELGYEFVLEDIEYTQGSVRVNGYILAAWIFVTPILQGYITNQLPNLSEYYPTNMSANESKRKFKQACRVIERVTTSTIIDFEKGSNVKSRKTVLEVRDTVEVCQDIIEANSYNKQFKSDS
ncbi:hypothetical protein GA076_24770 [Vibrio parahaemolyticus]|uniref:Uncharacterized protein n=3 Tax=Vibrio TaxID=662 RepID=A0AAW4HJA8_VIBVL|nr:MULTISPECIES: hypothetical protein [Vibrio]EGU9031419.1 hypothetical protein [Vibrio parahaemolyticus]EIO4610096.1 hypothetical protein [Vibrio parahaemolyticus]ELA3117967.1 hypothetical protein [Vibrio vulnificus]ELV8768206.1 hypothetical protein [Vibrio vulnificus]MBE3963448.1 hypothetical protein [Vibrio parahaemolyticus]